MGLSSKFNYHDIVDQITCRVQTRRSGTGVIVQPSQGGVHYVLTAKHVLWREDATQHTIETIGDCSIGLRCGARFQEIPRRCIEQAFCAGDDVALLVLRDATVSLPVVRLSVARHTSLPCFFRGYPQAYDMREGVTLPVNFTENGVVATTATLATYDSDPHYNCQGFSGSGVFCLVGNEPYLIGVITELREPFQRFRTHDLAFLNSLLASNDLPEIEMSELPPLAEIAKTTNVHAFTDISESPIPRNLVSNAQEGRIVLFLTRSLFLDAIHTQKRQYPSVDAVADQVADQFLGPGFKGYSVEQVMELAVSESDLAAVQEFVASQYDEFEPADYHTLIPRHVWHAIATTSIDLVIERAYAGEKDRLQTLVVFRKNGERVEHRLREASSVQFLKLHGCIAALNDPDIPLILTPNQYPTLRSGRSRLFKRLEEMAYEYPFLILSRSINDQDVHTAVQIISSVQGSRPMSYVVSENKTDAEVKLLLSKKFTHIHMHPRQFLSELDAALPSQFRAIATLKRDFDEPPVSKYFRPEAPSPSNSLQTFLDRDVLYIHSNLTTEDVNPKAFYRGYFNDFGPVISNLDVRRKTADDIVSEIFLATEADKSERVEFCVVKGHAGSGKSVLLKRLAWDAATDYDKICLFVNRAVSPEYEPLAELFRLCGRRIFLFLDPVREHIGLIQEFIAQARRDRLLLTVVGAERSSTWNSYCEDLDAYVTQQYQMRYLSEAEIRELVMLLERHNSLGYLEELAFGERCEQLKHQAGRQLLVALHEATLGKPFEEIVLDEYSALSNPRAQSLYLTVCIFHRLDVPVRAGLISRVHNIRFTEFEERLFRPLEFIVFAYYDKNVRDMVYRSRHSHVAELVFERVLANQQERFDEYVRVLNAIDIDYDSDYKTFVGLVSGKQMIATFDFTRTRQLYRIAKERVGDHPTLLQQEAIFEMSGPKDYTAAQELLEKAHKLKPRDRSIAHSLSVLARNRSLDSDNPLEKARYRQEARDIASKIARDSTISSYPYHTLAQVELDEIRELLTIEDDPTIQRKIGRLEQRISRALQLFPDDEFLLATEAEFNRVLGQNERALNSLERAFASNKSPYIALRLAKMYRTSGALEKAVQTLQTCLEFSPNDKGVHFYLAKLLAEDIRNAPKVEIRRHLRSAFTKGDTNYQAQFWYARLLYLEGEYDEAWQHFSDLREIDADRRILSEPRGIVSTPDNKRRQFSGVIEQMEASYGFIIRDKTQDKIFTHRQYCGSEQNWEMLRDNMRVKFHLAFSYKGPVAVDVRPE